MCPHFLLLLISVLAAEAADTLKGVVKCMNHEDCLGTNRVCSFDGGHTTHQNASGDFEVSRPNLRMGKCVCKQGFVQSGTNFACHRQRPPMEVRETCQRDEDCRLGEICMTWQYDPGTDNNARKLRSGLAPVRGERHQLCIDGWVIQQHMMDLDEPRTGGGLRSHRRDNFNADEYFFGGRRPPRVHQQYIGFAEDMMLILFLVCILATLVTVHRATCYRQFQEARRNTPLRHLLPIAEDRPPPYSHTGHTDTVDGIPEVVCTGSSLPKRISETPPPTYEEALYRNSVCLPGQPTESVRNQSVEVNLEDSSPLSPVNSPPTDTTTPAPTSTPAPAPAPVPSSASPTPPSVPVQVTDTECPQESSSSTVTDQLLPPKEEGKEQEQTQKLDDSTLNADTKTEGVGQAVAQSPGVIPV